MFAREVGIGVFKSIGSMNASTFSTILQGLPIYTKKLLCAHISPTVQYMKRSYPLTLAAAKKNEGSLWEIGDALLKECPIDGVPGKLVEACEYLQANGCDYDLPWLSRLRQVAYAFPPNSRRKELAFKVHEQAGSPAMLTAIVKGAKGITVTKRVAEKIVQRIRDHEERVRREAFERATAKREAAEAKEREKLARAKQATTEKERKERQAEHREAVEQTRKAREAQQEAKVPPKKSLLPPTEDEVPVLLVEASFLADASDSARKARRSKEAIAKCLDQLTAKGVAGLTDAALEAANAWTEAAQMVRKEVLDQRGHLSVLEK